MNLPDPRRYFTAEEIERADRYHRPARRIGLVAAGLSFALLAVLAFTPAGRGLAASFDDFPRWSFALSYAAAVVIAGAVLRFLFSVWRGHIHERRRGVCARGFGRW